MLKRTLFAALLVCRLAWAGPLDAFDRPGAGGTETALAAAEKQYRAGHDELGLIEVECLRLQRLFESPAPGLTRRLDALKELKLPPGRARARVYWIRALGAYREQHREEQARLEDLALGEPGVPPVLRAQWLCEATRRWFYDMPRLTDLVGRLSALHREAPRPEIQFYLMGGQASAADTRGQDDIARSLRMARQAIADKHGWVRDLHALLVEAPKGESWDDALGLALKQSSPLREELLFNTLRRSPDMERAQRVLARIPRPHSLKIRRAALLHADRVTRLRGWPALLEDYRRAGMVEQEMMAHITLAQELASEDRLRESFRHYQAALELRLAHPTQERYGTYSSGDIALLYCSKLRNSGYRHQALALGERALAEGWAETPAQLYRLRDDVHRVARELGDTERAQTQWLELLRTTPEGVSSQLRSQAYMQLYHACPPSLSRRKPEILQLARAAAEQRLTVQLSSLERLGTVYQMDFVLREQRDLPGIAQLWRSELQRCREAGDLNGAEKAATTLMFVLRDVGAVDESRRLTRELLQNPSTSDEARSQVLQFCIGLDKGNPQALVWAEELVRHTRKFDQKFLAGALDRRAGVQFEFERYSAALDSLTEAEASPTAWPGESRRRNAALRAKVLWKMGRRDEALAMVRKEVAQLQVGENLQTHVWSVRQLAEYLREQGKDWQGELETLLAWLDTQGERGEQARNYVLDIWLTFLAQDKDWQRGREVLQKYGWKESPLDRATTRMQAYPEWADLLPRPEAETRAPTAEPLAQVLDELRLAHPELGQLATLRPTNIRTLQSRLAPNETLVTYCPVGDELYLFALRSNGSFWRRTSGSAKGLVSGYLSALSSDETSAAERTLHAALLEPVLRADPSQRVLVVPTGELWQLPFGALRDAKGVPAAAQADFVMLTSGDLLRLADNAWQPYRLSRPLAIGAPPAADLPGAALELQEVSRLLPGCELRQGEEATLDVLARPDGRWGLLHIATHAEYRPERPNESAIQLHKGSLQLKQLSRLSLDENSLVTLSCCQGGDARGQRSDEPVTLATGFSAAGANTVVANLWRVDDEVARVFFSAFYVELAKGGSPMRSFRRAQDDCRAQFPRPRDWAGFFLLGNPT